MSINNATPQDWDKVAATGEPTFESYMERLNSKYVYDSTENYGDEVTADAEDFSDCWNDLAEDTARTQQLKGYLLAVDSLRQKYVERLRDELTESVAPNKAGASCDTDPRGEWLEYPSVDETNDLVNTPAHYNAGSIECIEAIEESMSANAFRGYLKGNCMKYLWRYSYKGKSLEDVQKAQWYLNKLAGALGG